MPEISRAEVAAFKMPKTHQGMTVAFYPWGNKDGRSPHLAFVIRSVSRNIVLRTAEGMVYDAVRHIDDPRLTQSVEQRENGAWDFTEESRRVKDEQQSILQRLDQLENKVDSLQSKAGKAAKRP